MLKASFTHAKQPEFSAFDEPENFGKWISSQPVRPGVVRIFNAWETDNLIVHYVEDTFPNGECRRRVLFSKGKCNSELSAWRKFASVCRQGGCSYIELFTTCRKLGLAWARLGAWRYPDSPVLAAWGSMTPVPVLLHGWDRENWTFLADNPQ